MEAEKEKSNFQKIIDIMDNDLKHRKPIEWHWIGTADELKEFENALKEVIEPKQLPETKNQQP